VTWKPKVMAKTSALVIPVVVTRLQQKKASQNHIFCCKLCLKQFFAPIFSSIHTDNFPVLVAKKLPLKESHTQVDF